MRILLPPSETKRLGGGKSSLALATFREPALNEARNAVLSVLHDLSSNQSEALRVLKLSQKQAALVETNRDLFTCPTLPAIERYTGVLYDALAAETLDSAARAWLDATTYVQSAAFGRVAASDGIPNYRLSASSALPGLAIDGIAVALKKFWQYSHAQVYAHAPASQEHPFTLDLRSKDYVALAPLNSDQPNAVWVNIVARGEDGVVRALNHFNKAAKGRLVRVLALTRPEIRNVAELSEWATSHGIEVSPATGGELNLVAESVRLEAGHPDSGNTRKNS